MDKEYNPQRDVANMMRAFGQEVKSTPEIPDVMSRILRARLMLEEVFETIERGLGVSINYEIGDEHHVIHFRDLKLRADLEPDLVELADGLGDTLVVTYGTGNACGINVPACFEEVHESNMSKTNADGSVTRDSYGKVVKPGHFRPPNMARVLGMNS
jgi:predicted HAD superfamily Cof-like phosphohydrolase